MRSNRLFLDIHITQTVPPSNVNRDDTGSPKTAQYGGVTRSRVSSQSWKKAIRDYFREKGGEKGVGIRSKDIVRYVASKILEKIEIDEEKAIEMAESVINGAGVKTKDHQAKALFFLGDEQAEKMAKAAIDEVKDKKILQKILNDNPAIDIALFGRMVADDPSLNEDASCQVAHAISTHAVVSEFDYFTALDDLSKEDNAGAGMLGTVEFNSSTLYRYANIALHEFEKQVGGVDAMTEGVKLFVEAFVNSMPTGKINTFANQTLPYQVLVILRKDRPVNLVTAFEEPVKTKEGYAKKSVEKLYKEVKKANKFVEKPVAIFELSTEENFEDIGGKKENSQYELLSDLGNAIKSELSE